MVLHWNGRALESLYSFVHDEGMAAWPVGSQRNQLVMVLLAGSFA